MKDNKKNRDNPSVLPEETSSNKNEGNGESKEKKEFTGNNQNKKSQPPVAGDEKSTGEKKRGNQYGNKDGGNNLW